MVLQQRWNSARITSGKERYQGDFYGCDCPFDCRCPGMARHPLRRPADRRLALAPARPPASWTGVLAWRAVGRRPPPACPQNPAAAGLAPTLNTANQSEDCLDLSVYAPTSGAQHRPMMVWFHGGGNEVGTGASYDGSALAADGVVVVTVNYRLGVLDFLATPALDAESLNHGSGDYGLMDQQAALRWVQANIAGFGGDPGNVTVFGQGSGGQDITDHLVSPGATGLFTRAIVESGAYSVQLPTLAVADAEGSAFATAVGCASTTDASCLRALPLSSILAGEEGPGSPYLSQNVLRYEPNIGTAILPTQPIEATALGQEQRVPLIVGTNHDEARALVAGEFDIAGAPLTASGYPAAITRVSGNSQLTPLIEVVYPLVAYPTLDLAFSAVFTDVGFSCISLLNDQLLSLRAPVYAYKFDDENAASLSLPSDPVLPLDAVTTTELPFLWPNLVGTGGASRGSFTAAEQVLAVEMRAAWTGFATGGNPNGVGVTPWSAFSPLLDRTHEFVPGATADRTGFAALHECDFWEPLDVAKAGMPEPTP